MSKQFTWWRRFYPTHKLGANQMFKGASQLLQRIEWGEYEMCPLWQQSYLEAQILDEQVTELELRMQGRFHADTIKGGIKDLEKKKYRREWQIKNHHIKQENEILGQLLKDLSLEFTNLESSTIWHWMEHSDLTTRQLYFTLRDLDQGREPKSPEQIDKIPRLIREQPRHRLKPKEARWQPQFKKTIGIHKIW